MEPKEIEKLAELVKIEITDAEKKKFAGEIAAILAYVKDVEKVSGGKIQKEAGELRNVLRSDENPHEPEVFTKAILDDAPETKDGFFKVKKVLGND